MHVFRRLLLAIKADDIPVKGLLHLLGDDLADLITQGAARGMKVEGDDIILMPEEVSLQPSLYSRHRSRSRPSFD